MKKCFWKCGICFNHKWSQKFHFFQFVQFSPNFNKKCWLLYPKVQAYVMVYETDVVEYNVSVEYVVLHVPSSFQFTNFLVHSEFFTIGSSSFLQYQCECTMYNVQCTHISSKSKMILENSSQSYFVYIAIALHYTGNTWIAYCELYGSYIMRHTYNV